MTTEDKQHSITTRHYSYLFTRPVIDVFESAEGSRLWTVDPGEVSEYPEKDSTVEEERD